MSSVPVRNLPYSAQCVCLNVSDFLQNLYSSDLCQKPVVHFQKEKPAFLVSQHESFLPCECVHTVQTHILTLYSMTGMLDKRNVVAFVLQSVFGTALLDVSENIKDEIMKNYV